VNSDVAGDQRNPAIAVSPNGNNIYISWSSDTNGDSKNWDIYFAKSSDAGASFGTNIKINTDATIEDQIRSDVAIHGATIHIVWEDQRDAYWGIYYDNSTNGGTSFSGNRKIDNSSGGAAVPSLWIDEYGLIYVAWYDARNSYLWDVFVTRSADSGISFQRERQVNDVPGSSDLPWEAYLSVRASDGLICIAWTDYRNGGIADDDIYFTSSKNFYDWEMNIRVNDDSTTTEQCRPSIYVLDGNVSICWEDMRGGNRDIYFARREIDIGLSTIYSWEEDFEDNTNGWEQQSPPAGTQDIATSEYYEGAKSLKYFADTYDSRNSVQFDYNFTRNGLDLIATSRTILSFAWMFPSVGSEYISLTIFLANPTRVMCYMSHIGSSWSYANGSNYFIWEYHNEGINQWHGHSRNLYGDYVSYWGVSPSTLHIARISLVIAFPTSQTAYHDSIRFKNDTSAPPAPVSPTPTPSTWTNDSSFSIDWTNPTHISGIKTGCWYKIGAPPTNNGDGTWQGSKPVTVTSLEGEQTVYLWLEDDESYSNYQNYSTTTLRLDTTAPNAPIGLSANPSGWTKTNTFSIEWANPTEQSGIKTGCYYKIDSAPTSNSDGTWSPSKPITVSSIEGEKTIYTWLEDNVGNRNYLNYATTTLRLDNTPPTSSVIDLPSTQTTTSFVVSWSGTDSGGSGVSKFDVQYKNGTDGSWNDWKMSIATTSDTFIGASGNTYYFRCRAIDEVGNVEDWPQDWDTMSMIIPPRLPNGTVSGTIVDKGHSPIEGAEIGFYGDDGSLKGQALSNVNGRFTIELPSGKYSMKVTRNNEEIYSEDVYVKSGEITPLGEVKTSLMGLHISAIIAGIVICIGILLGTTSLHYRKNRDERNNKLVRIVIAILIAVVASLIYGLIILATK